jgi:hypothetical protein
MNRLLVAALTLAVAIGAPVRETDLLIYGCTSGAIAAGVQATRMHKTVVMVCPEKHLGGLTAGGLGWTDSGDKAVIGGLSREFYHRVWQHYDQPDAWRWQKREEFGNKGQSGTAMDVGNRTMWIFEPHVAEQVYESWVKEAKIPIVRNAWLDREKGVKKQGDRIVSITTLDGKTYAAKMFIDATYEGDLMAAAGVDFHVGRESMQTYDEKWNGVQTGVLHHRHHFGAVKQPISPYVVPGDPKSGVLPRISAESPGKYGEGDNKVQAYCFRMCLTREPKNRVAFRSHPPTIRNNTNCCCAFSMPDGGKRSISSMQSRTARPIRTTTVHSARTISAPIGIIRMPPMHAVGRSFRSTSTISRAGCISSQ